MKTIIQLSVEKHGCHGHQYLLLMIVMSETVMKWLKDKSTLNETEWSSLLGSAYEECIKYLRKFFKGIFHSLFCNHQSFPSVLLMRERGGASSRVFPTAGYCGRISPVAKSLLISSNHHHYKESAEQPKQCRIIWQVG